MLRAVVGLLALVHMSSDMPLMNSITKYVLPFTEPVSTTCTMPECESRDKARHSWRNLCNTWLPAPCERTVLMATRRPVALLMALNTLPAPPVPNTRSMVYPEICGNGSSCSTTSLAASAGMTMSCEFMSPSSKPSTSVRMSASGHAKSRNALRCALAMQDTVSNRPRTIIQRFGAFCGHRLIWTPHRSCHPLSQLHCLPHLVE